MGRLFTVHVGVRDPDTGNLYGMDSDLMDMAELQGFMVRLKFAGYATSPDGMVTVFEHVAGSNRNHGKSRCGLVHWPTLAPPEVVGVLRFSKRWDWSRVLGTRESSDGC